MAGVVALVTHPEMAAKGRSLSLGENGQVTERAWRKALPRMLDKGSLTHLDLQGNSIGDEGAKAVAAAVAASGSLTHLDICDNNIGVEGAKAIAEVVAASGSLTRLSLRLNKIGDEGAKAIAGAVAASGSLTELWLANNNIGDEGAKALAAGISASGSLALKKLVVPDGLERHAELKAACEWKGVELK